MSALLIVTAVVAVWAAQQVWASRQADRVDWLRAQHDRIADPDRWRSVQTLLDPTPDGTHDRDPLLTAEARQAETERLERLLAVDERSATT